MDKNRFFCVRWLWENKKPVFIDLLWEKQVPIAVGEPLERGQSVGLGGRKYVSDSVPIFI